MNDDVDITECATNNGGCSLHATCTNTIGSYTCHCLPGYTGDGKDCHGKSQQFSKVSKMHLDLDLDLGPPVPTGTLGDE